MAKMADRVSKLRVPYSLYDLKTWAAGLLSRVGFYKRDDLVLNPDDPLRWDDVEARRTRYRFYQAMYDGTIYSDVHPWAKDVRKDGNLYRWIRPVKNQAGRIVECQSENVWGGNLDLEAGDGVGVPSAIPIAIPKGNEPDPEIGPDEEIPVHPLRRGISQLWKDSNWEQDRLVCPRKGATHGDVGLYCEVDEVEQKVRIRVVDAMSVTWLDRKCNGEVIAYRIDEWRFDPEVTKAPGIGPHPQQAQYTEICICDGTRCQFETLRNGVDYDWANRRLGTAETSYGKWTRPYPFNPLVWINHIPTGHMSGASELQLGAFKMQEGDESASHVGDFIRKVLTGGWMINTRKPSKTTRKRTSDTPEDEMAAESASGDSAGHVGAAITNRGDISILWVDDPNARAMQLVGAMPLGDAIRHYQNMDASVIDLYPEIKADPAVGNGETSGRTLRIAQKKAEHKLETRRNVYDPALVRVQKMCLWVGATNDWYGYEEIVLTSGMGLDDPALAHTIKKRPILYVGKMDDLEEQKAFWDCAQVAVNSGYELVSFLRDNGWDKDKIDTFIADKTKMAKLKQKLGPQIPAPGQSPPGGSPPTPKESPLAPPTQKVGQTSPNGTGVQVRG